MSRVGGCSLAMTWDRFRRIQVPVRPPAVIKARSVCGSKCGVRAVNRKAVVAEFTPVLVPGR